jgi:transcriptional regulator with XRE-family HTH domain
MLLGTQLRRLREGRQIPQSAAAQAIRGSRIQLLRMEQGRSRVREADVTDLPTLYGVTDAEERQAILELTAHANQPGWWQSYRDVLPGWFQTYIGLEETAEKIRAYEPQNVPDLLQTEAYAAAVLADQRMAAPLRCLVGQADEVDRCAYWGLLPLCAAKD